MLPAVYFKQAQREGTDVISRSRVLVVFVLKVRNYKTVITFL